MADHERPHAGGSYIVEKDGKLNQTRAPTKPREPGEYAAEVRAAKQKPKTAAAKPTAKPEEKPAE